MNYIADAKTKYFRNRTHYLYMRAAWSEAVNNPDIHLEAAHFMFYNAIRGKDITCGFKDRTNLKKIYHQGWINLAVDQAQHQLRVWSRYNIGELLVAFGDEIDAKTARQVIADMPNVPQNIEMSMFHQPKPGMTLSFEEWCDYYLAKQMNKVYENLKASQTPLEPWARKALWSALRKSATLISEGEFRE